MLKEKIRIKIQLKKKKKIKVTRQISDPSHKIG
jgi:hypothetical protein